SPAPRGSGREDQPSIGLGAAARRRARSSSPPRRPRSGSTRPAAGGSLALAPLAGLVAVLGLQQRALGEPQAEDHAGGGQRDPQQHMDPPRRPYGELKPQREDDDQRADDHRQEGRRAVADVKPRRLEPADVAPVGEADPAGEQRLRAAARAETEKGSLG